MPGKRFSAKEDRLAHHVADTYGGGKAALSVGYAVANKNRAKKKKKAKR